MTCAVVDYRISDACRARLISEGFEVITLPPHKALSTPVASHTDMLVLRIGDNLVINRDYAGNYPELIKKIRDKAKGYNIVFDETELRAKYPSDCVYNCLIANGKIFTAHTDNETLVRLANERNLDVMKIKQGYPACTTLLLNDSFAITADVGMAHVLESCGTTPTVIDNGDIALPPYEYGFIGGACGVYDGVVYFFGDVSKHRSYEKIATAITNAGMRYVSLSDEGLVDLGGILFL